MPDDDHELFATVRRELFTAVVGDVMDTMGLLRQFLPPQIRPLRDDMVIIGRAMTVLEADCGREEPPPHRVGAAASRPFGLMLDALDDLKPGEVYICTGSSLDYALWGELMSTRAIRLGAVGAVLDGYSRDTHGILRLNFPTFSRGRYAQDQAPRGRVVDYRCPLDFDGVTVRSGDIVFADIDGVCVVPRHAEREVLAAAFEKTRGEKTVRCAIEQGMAAREAYDTFGIM